MIDLRSRRRLGATRLELPPIGLGLAPLGNLYTAVSEAAAAATLEAAGHYGIEWMDVAPYYGFGLAEQRLGRYLRGNSGTPLIISTKVGRVLEPSATLSSHEHFVSPAGFQPVFDYSGPGIERSYADSLRRLGVERVQILLLHDIDRSSHPIDHRAFMRQIYDVAIPTLHRLKSDGRVDAIGLGVNDWQVGYEILASTDIDCILLAGRYTLLDQSAHTSGFLDTCARKGVAVLAGGVFNSGLLVGGSTYNYLPPEALLTERLQALVKVLQKHGVSTEAAALQFTAAHPAVTSIVVGARSPQEIDALIEGTATNIPPIVWQALRDASLISDDSPTPSCRISPD